MTLSNNDTAESKQNELEGIRKYSHHEFKSFDADQSQMLRKFEQLNSRQAWLTGAVLALFFGIGGLITWLVLENRAAPQDEFLDNTAQLEAPITSKIQQLEEEINTLKQQVSDDLTETLSVNQGAIQELEVQMQQLISKLNTFPIEPPNIDILEDSSELDEIDDDAPSSENTPDSNSAENF